MKVNPDTGFYKNSVTGGRPANEDSLDYRFLTPNGDIFVVCDGMGGHAGGATASKIAVDSICKYLLQAKYPDPQKALSDALEYANIQILATAAERPELNGMGTTACVVMIQDDKVWIAHCGDSRIYLYCAADQWLHRITKDHSFVQTLVDSGEITDAEAEHHPNKNRILKALGIKPDCKAEICKQPILPADGDTFLICSDGLSGVLDDDTLQKVLRQPVSVNEQGDMMLAMAKQAGWTDNVTLQLIQISESPHAESVFISKNPKSRAVPYVAKSKPAHDKCVVIKHGRHKRMLMTAFAGMAALVLVTATLLFISLRSNDSNAETKASEPLPEILDSLYNKLKDYKDCPTIPKEDYTVTYCDSLKYDCWKDPKHIINEITDQDLSKYIDNEWFMGIINEIKENNSQN